MPRDIKKHKESKEIPYSSEKIYTYIIDINNYENILNNPNSLKIRPKYWGGYSLSPYYFEFWQGHSKRINKREGYILKGDNWENFFLQP